MANISKPDQTTGTTESTATGTTEVAKLRAENERLKQQLAEAQGEQSPSTYRKEPSFGMSEGERQEIEARGSTVSPYTGDLRTAKDVPTGVKVEQSDKAREDGEKAAKREADRKAQQ